MDLSQIKKPWYIPGWLWNRAINKAAEALKEKLSPCAVAQYIAQTEAALLRRAVKDADKNALDKISGIAKDVADHSALVLAVIRDADISAEEEAELATSIETIATGYVSAATVNAKIDEYVLLLKV